MVTEKKWKILSDIGLDGHTKDGSILDINLIFGCRRFLVVGHFLLTVFIRNRQKEKSTNVFHFSSFAK